MDSEDPLFILYTSGSTGKPKGVLHTVGGYMVYTAVTHKYIFDYHDGDIYWCTADIGWVTGHSYIVYGPLANGATTRSCSRVSRLIPTPAASGTWCDKYKVNQFYTAPTAIRALMREGDELPQGARPVQPEAAGNGGRADQPRSLDVVSHQRRPREVPDRRHLVADRNRRHTDHPAARRHAHQARLGTLPFFGVKPKLLEPEGKEITVPAPACWCIEEPWPGHHADRLRPARPLQRNLLSAPIRACTSPATVAAATRTATTGSPAASTT